MSVTNAVRNPLRYLGGVWQTYRKLLFSPGAFYDDLDSRGLRKEIAAVLVVGIIGSIGTYYTYMQLMTPLTAGVSYGDTVEIDTEVALRLQGWGIQPVLYTIGLWILATFLLYFVSWVYNERGRFRHMLKDTAWGLVPLAFGYVIQSAVYAWVASGVETQTNNPNVWYENIPSATPAVQVQYIWGQVADEQVVLAATVVALAFLIWSWYIWAHAVVDVRKIDLRDAYLVAAVPTVLYAGYRLLSVAGIL